MQIRNGRIIYSPNSQRTVDIPSPLPPGANPFTPGFKPGTTKPNFWSLDASVYEQPQWYHTCFGWISFYDKTVLSSSSPLINVLRYSSSRFVFDEENGLHLSSSVKEDWLRLDNQLNRAYQAINHHYPTSALLTSRPYFFGYLRFHQSRGLLSLCLEKSKPWFGVWMALLSYCIAVAKCTRAHLQNSPCLAEPPWPELILRYGGDLNMDCVWLDMLLDTPIVNFSPDTSRAGTFIKLDSVDMYESAPSVEWFMEYGVPVWYEWSGVQASQVKNQRFAPLEYQLQDATTFRTKTPSPVPSPTNTNQSLSLDCGGSGSPPTSYQTSRAPTPDQIQTLPILTNYMNEFFRAREARIARLVERETPNQRTTRLSRKAQPPTKNARVFEWTQSGSGEYTYEEMPKIRRQEILEYYSEEQSRYDPVLNEWHCCELWGDFSDEDEDDGLPSFPIFEGDARPAEEAIPPPTSDLPIDDAPVEDFLLPNLDDEQQPLSNIRLLRLQDEILTLASLYFGYTPRVPVPEVPVLTDEKRRKAFCRCFGFIWDEVKTVDEVFADQSVAAAIDFFLRLAQSKTLLADEWDLSPDNPSPVSMSPRFRQIRLLQTKDATIYMLDLGKKSVAPWKLAVKSALNALAVCRLDPAFNECDIVEFLLTNGIPFHTLQPSSTSFSRTPHAQRPSVAPFRRPHEYNFGSRDYLAYRQRCHSILSHPRGRAALMHGHFMWRLALRSVRWEAVYNGPSGWSSNPDELLVARDPSTGMEYFDDKLSMDEQEALCGTYHCLIG